MEQSIDLGNRLRTAFQALAAIIRTVDERSWRTSPGPGVWSIGKEAEHVADSARYHQWIVRLTIGESVPSQRPMIERNLMTTTLSPTNAVELIRARTEEGIHLLRTLTDVQLDLQTKPARAKGERLGATIERVMIGHYDVHRESIAEKLRAAQ